jgi:hypothetical protein
MLDFRDTVNSKDLAPFVEDGRLKPHLVDAESRAAVVVFQTWVGSASDGQILLDLTNGKIAYWPTASGYSTPCLPDKLASRKLRCWRLC